MLARLTPYAGTAAVAAAAGWLIMLVGFMLQSADNIVPWEPLYNVMTAGGLIVGLATLVALNGLLARTGKAVDTWTILTVVLAVLGVAALTAVLWATAVWSALLSAASVIAVLRLRAAAPDSKVGLWAFAAAWPLGFGLFVLLDAWKIGRVDAYGDHPLAAGIGLAVWCGLFALGLAMHAKWLRSDGEAATA